VTSGGSKLIPAGQTPIRHGLRFIVSGGVAFAVDAAVLSGLNSGLGMPPIPARAAAIALAMVAAWLMHRTFSFAVAAPPSVPEFLRFAGVAWTAAAINYGGFVLIMVFNPRLAPLAAMIFSSAVAMVFSYLGMRFAAFRDRCALPRN
jgi:putative flippase GtrA